MNFTPSGALRGAASIVVVVLALLVTSSAFACQGTNRQYREYTAPTNVALPALGGRLSLTTATNFNFSGCHPTNNIIYFWVFGSNYDAATSAFYDSRNAPGLGVRIRFNGTLITSERFKMLNPPASGSWPITYEVIRRSTASLVQSGSVPHVFVSICGHAAVAGSFGCPLVEGNDTFINRLYYPAQPATCQLSDIAPRLAVLRAADLPAVGSTAAGNAGFAVPMTCANGNMSSVPIRFTLKDAQATGNTSNQLTPIPGSTTSAGVRLQLLRRPAGGSYAVQNMGASWTQTKTPTGTFPAPDLAVRYIRTGAISPGTIGSAVTLTMDYP
ncbi:hypothetical protein [Stenotrophomonas sp. BIGb0135]|uniref:hypothetical protein n=1 Tax=Stenotrophomonas sp. BIGb0135 TaxID=2940620 RepID=UPI00216A10EE|nr:hypothetical protein [Stenotrophomonas sp. BIGb0135]MCS4233046.1 type 1 fimbria pilin [Stenotrophomonas sp. BIGb0135]